MSLDAAGSGVQTCLLVYVSTLAYERHICSAACRRNIWNWTDLSLHLYTAPLCLPD